MAGEQILLIKPRWLSAESLETQRRLFHQEYPDARFTLLSDHPPLPDAAEANQGAQTMPWLAMPLLRRKGLKSLFSTLWKLRQRRYTAAIILADNARREEGYGEAKFWVFAARAKRRRLGAIRDLNLSEELLDKARRVAIPRLVSWLVTRLPTPRSAEIVGAGRAQTRLQAFILLLQGAKRRNGHLGAFLAIDESASPSTRALTREVAREQGWHAYSLVQNTETRTPALPHGHDSTEGDFPDESIPPQFDYITLTVPENGSEITLPSALVERFRNLRTLLTPDGYALIHLPARCLTTDDAEPSPASLPAELLPCGLSLQQITAQAGLQIVALQPSLFTARGMDLWVTPAVTRVRTGETLS